MIEPEYRLHGWPRQTADEAHLASASNPSKEPNPAPQEARVRRRLWLPLLARLTGWARGLLGR